MPVTDIGLVEKFVLQWDEFAGSFTVFAYVRVTNVTPNVYTVKQWTWEPATTDVNELFTTISTDLDAEFGT